MGTHTLGGVVGLQHHRRQRTHVRWSERLDGLDLVGRLNTLRSRPQLHGLGTALLFLAVVGSLQVVQLVRAPAAGSLAAIASRADLMNAISVLAAAALVYLDWWITGNEVMGWLAAGLLVAGVTGTGTAALTGTDSPVAVPAGWDGVLTLLVAAQLLGVLVLARRRRCAGRPLAAGVGGGVLLTAVALALSDSGALPELSASVRVVVVTALCAVCVATVLALLQLASTPRWFRVQLAAASGLLGCSEVAAHVGAGGLPSDIVVLTAGGAGGAAAWGATYVTVQQAINEGTRSLSQLRQQVRQLEEASRAERVQRHEVEATLAGITTAAALLRASSGLSPARRRVLEQMVQSETARLHRLVSNEGAGQIRAVHLDHVVEPLVERLRVHGHQIVWSPAGLRALCEPDELAAALSVLLENAARHAPGSVVSVTTRVSGSRVEVVVSDTGDGIAPEVRPRLFQWGARRPGSPGQGIGLHNAWQLVRRQRGDLTLVEEPGHGATFVIGLRRPEGGDDGPVVDRAVASASAQ